MPYLPGAVAGRLCVCVRVVWGGVCAGWCGVCRLRPIACGEGGFWATPKSCRGTIFLIWFRLWKLRPNRVEARFFYPISTPPELCGGK